MAILNRAKSQTARRTDEIRRKQAQRAKQAMQRAARRRRNRTYSHTLPPVMAREPIIGTPETSRVMGRAPRTKRRYAVRLAAPGSELRLPAMPVVRFNWRILSALMSGVFFWILFQFWSSPVYRVEAVEYAGLQRLAKQELDTFLNLQGVQIFVVDGKAIQRQLTMLYPEFTTVSVQVSWPNTVMVSVTERLPVLVWMKDERSNFVDAEGTVFPVREGMSIEGLPVVEAYAYPPAEISVNVEPFILEPNFEKLLDQLRAQTSPNADQSGFRLEPAFVKAILFLAQNAPENAVLIYDQEHGLGWLDHRGWQVYFGDAKHLELKMNVYKVILEQLKAKDTKPEIISVESVEAPYVQLES